MSLYLKYRPQNVSELDLLSARTTLEKILKTKTDLPHAFLFVGPRGTGKTSSARILAKTINGDEDILQSPDVVEIDAASNRGIDEIRSLRESIALAPMQAKYKVYIIDEVHMLTTEAFNALLKTLEEPPAHAVFVLCTTEGHKLPETVISRCTVVQFSKPSLPEVLTKLKLIVEKEKWTVSEAELNNIATAAKGSFRDAIKLLETFHLTGQSLENATDVSDFLLKLQARDQDGCLEFIAQKEDQGVNWREFVESCVAVLHQQLLQQKDRRTLDLIRKLEQAYVQMKEAIIPQLALEMLVLESGSEKTPPPVVAPPVVTKSPVSAPVVSVAAARNPGKNKGRFTIIDLQQKWPEVLKNIKALNHSAEALMKSTRPTEFDGDVLELEVFYKFHKDKLESDKCRSAIETGVGTTFGIEPIFLRLNLGEKQAKKSELSGDAGADILKAAEEIFKVEAV